MSENNKNRNLIRTFQLFTVDLALTVTGILTLAGGLWSVFNANATMVAACMGTGLVLLFAATIQRFELLKGLGMEAKVLRLNATIDQAEKALDGLKALTEMSTEALIFLSSSAGRYDGVPNLRRAQGLANNVKKILATVDASPDAVSRILAPWISNEVQGLAWAVMQPFVALLDQKKSNLSIQGSASGMAVDQSNPFIVRAEALLEYQNSLSKFILSLDPQETFKGLVGFIEKCPEITDEEKANLKSDLRPFDSEVRHFVEHKDFGDISFWSKHLPYRN